MAPKKAFVIVSGIKAAFAKQKSKQSTSSTSEGDASITSAPEAVTAAAARLPQDPIRTEIGAPKQADAGITELFPDFADHVRSDTPKETAFPPLASPPPTTSSRPISARPCDIMSKHASLLLIPAPQATIVDLPTEFSKASKFTSPLPINPAAASLSRSHFKCPGKHACFRKSSNIHAPTLCTTCHGSGHAVLACCRFCYLRICKRCAGILNKCGNDLQSMLEELVRLSVWRGLQGQG